MDTFTVIGLLVVLYILVYIVLLVFVDCDLGLLWSIHFGIGLDSFKGKVVWVTGASSGIGEFLSVLLAKNGAELILSARSLSNLERVRKKCVEAGSSIENIFILPMDITETELHHQHFERVLDRFGKLDILINNAGRSQRAIWEEIELDVDRQIFDINVFGALSLSRLAVRYFEKAGKGHLVAMSSLAGLFSPPFSASYSATKHAIHGYYKTLMAEKLGGNIAVTLICPGPVFSNLLPACFTGKEGESFGELMTDSDKRMTTERCAYLSAVAIANRLDEAWIGLVPTILLTYIVVYFPNISKLVARSLGTKFMVNLRDSRQTVKKVD